MHKALGICDNAAGIPSWSELHCPGTRLRLPNLVRCRLIVWSVYEAEPVSGQEHHSRRSRRPSLWIRYRRDFRHYGCPHAELPALVAVIGAHHCKRSLEKCDLSMSSRISRMEHLFDTGAEI